MTIAENNPHGIAADGLQPHHEDIAFATNKLLLPRPVTLDLGAGAFDAQILSVQIKRFAIVEADRQYTAFLPRSEFEWPDVSHS